MDDLLDFEDEGEWRPRRVSTANTLVLGDEARDVTVRAFRTLKPFEKEKLVSNLRKGKLSETAPIGVIHYLSDDADPDVRVVVARQGESKLRRYDPNREEVDWWALPRTLLGVFAVRYSADEDGHLKFTMFGGGGVPQKMVEWFHETFADVNKDEPKPIALAPALVRARCFDPRFLERLYAIQAQIDDTAHQTIDHTQFKSREFIDPDCEAMVGLRTAERLLIEAFDSEVTIKTPDLDDEVRLRFLLRTAAGSLRLTVPKLPFRPGLRDLSALTRAFYDLCEYAVAEIVGTDPSSLANLDPGNDDGLLATVVDLKGFRRWLTNPGNRSRFFYDLNLSLSAGRWLPHLRALDEMLAEPSPPHDVEGLCQRLAREDPEGALLLAQTLRGRGLPRIEALAVKAVAARYRTLPRQLYALADDVLLSAAQADPATHWNYDSQEDLVSTLGATIRASACAPADLAAMLRRCAQAEHTRLLTTASSQVGDLRPLSAILSRLAACARPGLDDPGARALAEEAREPGGIVCRLLGPDAADDDDTASRVLALYSLPLWPSLVVIGGKGGREVRNGGPGSAVSVQVALLPLGDIPPGGSVALPKGAGSGPISFLRFGRRWEVGLAAEEQDAPPARPDPRVHVPRERLAEFRRSADPGDTIRGESEALWQAFEDAFLASRHPGRPRVLLLGATGTGKTEFAQLLHRSARLDDERFVRIGAGNFSEAGDENILRGELIGYGKDHGIKGIPSGKKGYLQNADAGTLFIDDFDGLPPRVQVLLLDVLAGVHVRAVSGDEVPVRCRVMLATNADLGEMVQQRQMRADLLQRVDATVNLPPLAQRPTDVFAILGQPKSKASTSPSAPVPLRPTRRAWSALLRHTWPGNVRELRKCWDDAVVLAGAVGATEVDVTHLRRLPDDLVREVAAMSEKDALRDVVAAAERHARDEGYLPARRGSGLWRRVSELTGIGVSTISRALPPEGTLAGE